MRGPIVVLRSDHDQALRVLYTGLSGSGEAGRSRRRTEEPGAQERWPGRRGHIPTVGATSAMGAVGARGVGAAEIDLVEAQAIGVPRHPIINVDASRVVNATRALLGAHRDIHHPEIATLILLAGRLLEASAAGARPRRLTAFELA